MSRKHEDYSLMPCMTCKSFNPDVRYAAGSSVELAGGCHGCGTIYYGQVVECALHRPIGEPDKDFFYFERKRAEWARRFPDLAKNRIFYIGERGLAYYNSLKKDETEANS